MALKELIETIAKALVDDPDSVEVTEIEGEHNFLIELRVAKDDAEATVRQRLKVYHDQTFPLVDFYSKLAAEKRVHYAKVEGIGSVDDIRQAVLSKLKRFES